MAELRVGGAEVGAVAATAARMVQSLCADSPQITPIRPEMPIENSFGREVITVR